MEAKGEKEEENDMGTGETGLLGGDGIGNWILGGGRSRTEIVGRFGRGNKGEMSAVDAGELLTRARL